MAGTFDPVAARAAVERFAKDLADLELSDPSTMAALRRFWERAYVECGHKALGRLMIGKNSDEVCKSFEK
ncbi:MAG: hypothetical protein M0T85_15695 [Dehalococcoidales bacterium]|nr:hypothetical protein [Dehalococcoidales bacterium]